MLSTVRGDAPFTGRLGVGSVVASTIAFELFVLVNPFDPVVFTVLDELLLAVSGMLAFAACIGRVHRDHGRHRTGWRLMGLCCFSFGLSQVAYAIESWASQTTVLKTGSIADVFAAIACPFAVAGLILLIGRLSVTSRLVTLLDGFVIALSLVYVAWAVALGSLFRDPKSDAVVRAANLFYTASTVALVAIVLVLAMRWRGDGPTLWLMGLAFGWLTVSNLGFALGNSKGWYQTGNSWIDVGWFASFLIIALAAARPVHDDAEGTESRRTLLTLLIPYGALLIVAVTTYVIVLRNVHFDLFLQVTALTVVLLALARQLVTLLDNQRLNRELESRVAERSAAALASEERMSSLLRNSSDVIAVVNVESRLRYASPAARALFGVEPDEFIGHRMMKFVHPDDHASTVDALARVVADGLLATTVNFRVETVDGFRQIEATMSSLRDDPIGEGIILNLRDVTERAALQAELQRQASYDQLTSLANRRLFNERLHHSLERARRSGESIAVLFIDLDHFKKVNDSSGHASGDELLVEVSQRLQTCLRPSDTAARLGGDEFAVLLEDTSAEDASIVAERVIDALGPALSVGGRHVAVTASIGIAVSVGGDLDVDALLRDADVAMYQAKAAGRARFAVFEASMHTQVVEQLELESDLRHAIEHDELRLVYQPIVDLSTFAMVGVEALLRWRRRGDVDVPPSLFIPVAEQAGLIPTLDEWVLVQACGQVAAWHERFPRHASLKLNVNVSALELSDGSLVPTVSSVLFSSGLAARHLVVEITETAILPDAPSIDETVHGLRGMGVGVSLDDFGTGYSSLAALRRFPLDEIKLDRSFVHTIERSQHGRSLVQSILSMAQVLGLHTVAEGIETPDQLELLRSLGCRTGQGYLISKPKSAVELEKTFTGSALGSGAVAGSFGVVGRLAEVPGSIAM